MAKRPTKKKALPVKVVKRERKPKTPKPVAASQVTEEEAWWRKPSAHHLKLDEARLNYWRAKIAGEDLTAPLKAWADLLHVPRTRAKAVG